MDCKGVCVVVVFFNPTKEQIVRYECLALSVPVIVVDNSHYENTIQNVTYIPLGRNVGIAAAQNIGIKKAKELFFKYLVFFDQDSIVRTDYIVDIVNEYDYIKRTDDSVAVVGPIVVEEITKKEYKNEIEKYLPYSQVGIVISSGSVVETRLFDIVGFYEEKLFIDLVDCEWCWRAKYLGYHIYQTRRVELLHTVGKKCVMFLGVYWGVSSSIRYFYYYRNLLWMLRREYVPFRFKWRASMRAFFEFFVIPFLSDEGIDCSKQMLRGVKAGLKKSR